MVVRIRRALLLLTAGVLGGAGALALDLWADMTPERWESSQLVVGDLPPAWWHCSSIDDPCTEKRCAGDQVWLEDIASRTGVEYVNESCVMVEVSAGRISDVGLTRNRLIYLDEPIRTTLWIPLFTTKTAKWRSNQ